MKKIFLFFLDIFNIYKKKRFKILTYEIYFALRYFKSGNYFKFRNHDKMTDTIPCPYYFIYKISKFINKEKINNLVDLGSGYGRLTNFLHDNTEASIWGYELDKDVFDISIKNKRENIIIENKNILDVDYKELKVDCFILNDPLHQKKDLEYLIKKIKVIESNLKKKYYLITININEEKMHIFNEYKLLKITSAGFSKNVKFFSNEL